MISVTELLDMLEDSLEKSWSLPLSGGRSVVDVEKLLDIVSDVRLNLPTELKQAKMIVADRQDILKEAKAEAEKIIRDAELKAKRLVSEDQLVKDAKARANQMLVAAQTQAIEVKHLTNDYVEKVLSSSEETLLKNLQVLKEAHSAIRKTSK